MSIVFNNTFIAAIPSLEYLGKIVKNLAANAFRPGTGKNHRLQAQLYVEFCDEFEMPFLDPSVSTLTYYIAFLTDRFTSAASVRNYVSGIRTLHKQLQDCTA
jgi:hypothetical protein